LCYIIKIAINKLMRFNNSSSGRQQNI